jgi:hypothetical protein
MGESHGWLRGCASGRDRGICGRRLSLLADPAPLGITAFGVTAWTARAAGDRVINERDEDDPTADQELFLVMRGHAVFEFDSGRVDAPAGTLRFAPPRTKQLISD